MTATFVLNFGHPLHPRVVAHLAPAKEVRVRFDLDLAQPTPEQIVDLVDRTAQAMEVKGGKLDGTVPLAVALPGLSEGVALLLAELHGRTGNFPKVLALRKQADGTYGLFADSAGLGVLDLEKLRQEARGRR